MSATLTFAAIPLLVRRVEFVLRHWARLQEAEEDEDLKEMLEDVVGLFTETKVREVLLDSAARASAHIGQVSATLYTRQNQPHVARLTLDS